MHTLLSSSFSVSSSQQVLGTIVAFLLTSLSASASALQKEAEETHSNHDWHCLIENKQTSVDFPPPGYVKTTTCNAYSILTSRELKKERKKCENKNRRSRKALWDSGGCPLKNEIGKSYIGRCTIRNIAFAQLKQPIITYNYEEIGGNLRLADEVELVQAQCSQKGRSPDNFEIAPAVAKLLGGYTALDNTLPENTATDSVQEKSPKVKESATKSNTNKQPGVEDAAKGVRSFFKKLIDGG